MSRPEICEKQSKTSVIKRNKAVFGKKRLKMFSYIKYKDEIILFTKNSEKPIAISTKIVYNNHNIQ